MGMGMDMCFGHTDGLQLELAEGLGQGGGLVLRTGS